MREIEIKMRVADLNKIEEKLKKAGCIFSEPINQHDTTYSKKGSTSEYTSAKEGDIILRIRKQDNKTEFNLKKQCSSESDNIECETDISDPESMHRILNELDWVSQIEVKKIRRKGKLGEYEICLDQVEKLGSFMEIEKMVDDNSDPEIIREELFKILEELGLSRKDEESRGYDTQIFQLENKI